MWSASIIVSRPAIDVTWPPTTIVDLFGADRDGAAARFAREMILDWIAAEARNAAGAGISERRRLASANQLWEKAQAVFADADEYNLDARQTLILVLDAIRKHVPNQASITEPI